MCRILIQHKPLVMQWWDGRLEWPDKNAIAFVGQSPLFVASKNFEGFSNFIENTEKVCILAS